MAIDPRGADLKRFLDNGEPGEVVMINLLRFAEGGREQYEGIVIARYPSRKAFSSMVADPGYQAITHLRTKALRETVLQPTTPWRV